MLSLESAHQHNYAFSSLKYSDLVVLQLLIIGQGWIFMVTNEYGVELSLTNMSGAIQLCICLLRLVNVFFFFNSHVQAVAFVHVHVGK